MAQHFLLSSRARTLSLASVNGVVKSDEEAEKTFSPPSAGPRPTASQSVSHCGGLNPYQDRRPSGSMRYRCKACKGSFALTSGTLFAFHKLPLRTYLAAIAIYIQRGEGQKSRSAWHRDLDVNAKTGLGTGAQNPRSRRIRNEGRACRRRRQNRRSGFRLFRRICEARKFCGEPHRPSSRHQSEWQTPAPSS